MPTSPNLREFLLRGGTAMFDDFHGPIEWDNLAAEMKRVFPGPPDRRFPRGSSRLLVLLQARRAIHRLPASARSWPAAPGRRAAIVAHLRTIFDDNGRPMVFINWNTDMGDGWEWSNAEEYPGYIRYTALVYRMGINEIVYALTH